VEIEANDLNAYSSPFRTRPANKKSRTKYHQQQNKHRDKREEGVPHIFEHREPPFHQPLVEFSNCLSEQDSFVLPLNAPNLISKCEKTGR